MLLLEHEEELANVAGGADTAVARGVSLLTQGKGNEESNLIVDVVTVIQTQNASAATAAAGAYPKEPMSLMPTPKQQAGSSPGAESREGGGPAVENSTSGGGWVLEAGCMIRERKKRGIHQSAIVRCSHVDAVVATW